ncbi:MAG: hypothetical protein KKF42_05600, partial [Actinobacteria bacterium]|nr:hypothetical protein [Actinomycetota bacterium]
LFAWLQPKSVDVHDLGGGQFFESEVAHAFRLACIAASASVVIHHCGSRYLDIEIPQQPG